MSEMHYWPTGALVRNTSADPTGERLRQKIVACGGPVDDGPVEDIELSLTGFKADGNIAEVTIGTFRVRVMAEEKIDPSRKPKLVLRVPVQR